MERATKPEKESKSEWQTSETCAAWRPMENLGWCMEIYMFEVQQIDQSEKDLEGSNRRKNMVVIQRYVKVRNIGI